MRSAARGLRAARTRLFGLSKKERVRKARGTDALAILEAEQEAMLDGVLVVGNDREVLSYNRRFLEIWNFPEQEIDSRRESGVFKLALARVTDPDGFVALVNEIYAQPRSTRVGDLIPFRDGRIISRTTVPVIAHDGSVQGRVWYFRDISQTARAEAVTAALFRIAEISRSADNFEELFRELHGIIGRLMDATNFYIALYDDATGHISFPIFVDEIDPEPPTSPGEGLTWYVLKTGLAVLATPEKVEELVKRGEIADVGAPSVDWLGVPLKTGDTTIGVMVVQSYDENVRYGERDKELLQFVSNHIASVIEDKRKEDVLRERERLYRQMFKNNQAIKLVIDPLNGDIVDANPAACAFYGYTEDELLELKIWDLNIGDPATVREKMRMATDQDLGYFVFRHRLANGELRDVEVHSGPIEVKGRSYLYSIIHDITERLKAEKALRRSEEHFRSLIENTSDMIAIVDVQGTIHYTSPSVERVLGLDAKSTVGGNIFDLAHPDDIGAAAKALTEAFEGQPVSHALEIRVRHRSGEWRFIEGLTHRLEAESGERLVVNCRDVTERKQVEATLQTHSAAMEASMDGIAILDAAGRFTYVNLAFLKLYGYRSRADLVGQHWRLLHDRKTSKKIMKDLIPTFAAKGEWRDESQGKRRDGRTFPIEVSLTRIGNGSTVCVVRDITERTLAEEQIKHLAYHDALTGLPNRLLFKDRLIVALSHAQREKHMLAVLFLDLDRFKVINDSLGHDFGDHLLQEVARRIQRCLRETDTVSRLGGDEFTILLPVLHSSEDAARIARKVLDAVRAPIYLSEREFYTTTSVGIAIYPEDGTDAESLLKNADTAMYQAKEHGRDNYQIFNAAINEKAVERLSLEHGLRKAITNREFVLYYQPIFDLRRQRIRGMEALLRWQHPELGLLLPGSFIQAAETTGLMVSIGAWALEAACEQARAWHDQGFTDLTVAVNLSVAQLQQADLVQQVRRVLEITGLPARNLELEITESGAMQKPESSIHALQQLRKLGVRVALDDFGIGHSSLSHLKRFPIDTLKIDQSFIRDITADAETAAIVEGIIAIGHTLRLTVVAEGVEIETQRSFLQDHDCDLMQGFLYKRPIPAAEFEQLLQSEK